VYLGFWENAPSYRHRAGLGKQQGSREVDISLSSPTAFMAACTEAYGVTPILTVAEQWTGLWILFIHSLREVHRRVGRGPAGDFQVLRQGLQASGQNKNPGYLRKELRKSGQTKRIPEGILIVFWSGKRDSNPRLRPWQDALLPCLHMNRYADKCLKINALQKNNWQFCLLRNAVYTI
jgi:hypothetical protein